MVRNISKSPVWYENIKKEIEDKMGKATSGFEYVVDMFGTLGAIEIDDGGVNLHHYHKEKKAKTWYYNDQEVDEKLIQNQDFTHYVSISKLLGLSKFSFDKDELKRTIEEQAKAGRSINPPNDIIKNIFWLYDEAFDEKKFKAVPDITIAWVKELKGNRRVFILKGSYQSELLIRNCKAKDYDWIDVGRRRIKGAWVDNDLEGVKIDEDILPYGLDEPVLTKEIYERYANEGALERTKEEREQEMEKALESAIEKKLQTAEHTPFEFNEMKFSNQYVESKDMKLGGKRCRFAKKGGFYKRLDWDEDLDFQSIVKQFIEEIKKFHFKADNKFSFEFNSIKVKPSADDNSRWFINKTRINQEDAMVCMTKAFEFKTQKEYNAFLNRISKTSLKIQKALEKGLFYKLGEANSKLKIAMEGNSKYIMLPKKRIKIKDINKMLTLDKGYDAEPVLNKLRKGTYATEDEIIEILQEGMKEHKEAIKRSEELLKETIKNLKVREVTRKTENDKEQGYVIKGKSGKTYFVTKEAKTYELPSMKYICIVEKDKDFVGMDRIVSRLMALANDTITSLQIHTLSQNLMNN